MFDDNYVGGLSVNKIMEGQDSVFGHYLGSFPNELERHHSPFRSDSNPGCRFQFQDGIWWFIDNATYKNKLRFNCIHLVQYMFDIGYQEAINKISEDVIFSNAVFPEPDIFIPKIKVKLQAMPKVNHFSQYGLPNKYLKNEVKSVKYYYANTRKHNYLKRNAFYNPYYQETYAYLVNGKIELYFPGADIKFVKETLGSDHYGNNDNEEYVVIVEGNKDRMIVDYHYNLNVIGLQNVYSLPELTNKKIIILLDPDDAGIQGSLRLMKKYPNAHNLTKLSNELDIADMYLEDKDKLDQLMNECKKIIDAKS
jgi:hypothetical protein